MIDKHITDVMNEEERIVFELRSLYGRYGYKPYRMSKFEEYDLYAKNKDFLISEDVIAFTDKSGRLMALKPDVTISIVKGSRYAQRSVEKLCYNENVYRVSKGGDTFSEIMQAGLECIGDIDTYCVGEVLSLAASSLDLISHDFILDVSHIGLLLTAVNSLGLASEAARAVYMLAASKNVHELAAVCREGGVPDDKTAALCELLSIYGRADDVLPDVRRLSGVFGAEAECNELASSVGMLTTSSLRERVKIDFSVVSDAG